VLGDILEVPIPLERFANANAAGIAASVLRTG